MSKVIEFSHSRKEGAIHGHSVLNGENGSEECVLDRMCNSLDVTENSKKFKAFPEAYCRRFGLTQEQIHAVTDLDILRMLQLGAAVDCMEKLTRIYGMDVLDLCIQQTGKTADEARVILEKH